MYLSLEHPFARLTGKNDAHDKTNFAERITGFDIKVRERDININLCNTDSLLLARRPFLLSPPERDTLCTTLVLSGGERLDKKKRN